MLSIDWHPNNALLTAGSCDIKCRVFSASLKKEKKPATSGSRLAWVSHDSTVSVAHASKSMQVSLKKQSPCSENSVVATGHGCCPLLFNYHHYSFITFASELDIPERSNQHNISWDKRAMTEARNQALETLRQNSTAQVSSSEVGQQGCCKFHATGIDGGMTIWSFKTLESTIQGLQII
ncbi:Actin-related protein 2/3 complex subunit 1A [Galemys pyrenaicus]|uniref:Actin-related protein 2/3 complex subunit 1A n=1 Tax=Galemys pyrenaicus TaxID=202257 RepID=A0A8J6DI84_GALPY|nr:Actin-related protein 2/3 complex subunit 1A [Galemys pyrenaicus]